MTFPTIDPRGLFGSPHQDGMPGIGTHLHSAIQAYHDREIAKGRRIAIEAPRRFGKTRLVSDTPRLVVHNLSGMQDDMLRSFVGNIRRELNKHPRAFMPSRDRTTSFRKRAGSRKGNGRRSTLRDRGWETDWNVCPYTTACYAHNHERPY